MHKICHCSICFKLWNRPVLVVLSLEIMIDKNNRVRIKIFKKGLNAWFRSHFRTFEQHFDSYFIPYIYFFSSLNNELTGVFQVWEKSNVMLRLQRMATKKAFCLSVACCFFRYNIPSSFPVSEKYFFHFLSFFSGKYTKNYVPTKCMLFTHIFK